MKKKIIVYFLLFAFAHYIAACAIYKTDTQLPVQTSPKQVIKKAVLTTGKTIEFNKAGGTAVFIENSVVGAQNYKSLVIDAANIKEFRTEIKTMTLKEALDKPIYEIVDAKNMLIQFDAEGGKFNKETNKITGKDSTGQELIVPITNALLLIGAKPKTVTVDELKQDSSIRIAQVVSTANATATFDNQDGLYKSNGLVITGVTIDGSFVTLDADNILYVEIEKVDAALSIFASIGVVAASVGVLVLIIMALKESCPFIYSYDGAQYVFDAEPLGGATAEIYHRSELSMLNHLKDDNGKYKLMISNEVNETQFVDALNLQYVDHSPAEIVYPDYKGQYYFVDKPAEILSAYDENGNDLSAFLKKDDGTFWMTKMTGEEENLKNKIRNEITVTLPKPENADKVNLVINSGTTMWGSNIIREMLNLYGNSVEEYYNKINEGGTELQNTTNFLQKEELYQMKLYAKSGDNWIQKGIINGGGPLISETRIVQVDVSDIPGDKLVLKMNPPVGFWTLDYIAADYSLKKADFHSLDLTRAYTTDGRDLMSVMQSADKDYYSMPDKGMRFFAEFDAPPLRDGMTRSIFSNTSGYYKVHTDNNGPANAELLFQLVFSEGKIVRYSTAKYFEWMNKIEKNSAEVMR